MTTLKETENITQPKDYVERPRPGRGNRPVDEIGPAIWGCLLLSMTGLAGIVVYLLFV